MAGELDSEAASAYARPRSLNKQRAYLLRFKLEVTDGIAAEEVALYLNARAPSQDSGAVGIRRYSPRLLR